MNIQITHAPVCRVVLTLLSAALTLGLIGANPAARAQSDTPAPPFDAVVVEDNVQVRSGAGRAYYEVGTLPQGAKVVIEADLFGWYKIACPEGVFCFVERKNVNVRGDGSLGVVETDNTPINAAHATKGPADSYRNLLKLNAGDSVEIIDTVNNAYKIKPPKDAYVFLPPGSIEPASKTPAPVPTPTQPEKPEPVVPETPALKQPETPGPAPAEDLTPPDSPIVVAPPVAPTPDLRPNPRPPVDPEVVVVNPPRPVTPRPVEVVEAPTRPDPTDISFESPTEPAAAKPKTPDLLTDADAKVPLPDVPVDSKASNEMLRAVEVAMLPYLSLPVDEQPIAKMVRGYADAAQMADLGESDLAIVRARLTELERNRELATALRQVDAVAMEINDAPPAPAPAPAGTADSGTAVGATTSMPDPLADATTPDEMTSVAPTSPVAVVETPAPSQADRPAPDSTPASAYDAIGILTPSTVHTGSDQPQLLRLLDPTGRRTVAYLEPGEAIDTVQMIGRIVGIVGESIYDPTTRLNLIRPTRVDILSPR